LFRFTNRLPPDNWPARRKLGLCLGANSDRLLGMEYTAAYGLGNEVPYYNMYDKFKDSISEKSRGNFEPIFERVYNHYVRVKGLPMPFTEQVIEQERPEGFTSSMTSWGTLTAYQEGLVQETQAAAVPKK
ncbi:hypothetical protein P4E94_18130, partial [Pontiellaceae bacterium B12219]|nr:hypothetical protein [Pontiellaceae bacterium B12219]